MIAKNFVFNGVTIPYTTAEGVANGWIADILWTDLTTRNSLIPRQDFHGSISNPTFLDGRLITIRGEIFASNKNTRETIYRVVKDAFLVENFPTPSNEFKALTFEDHNGDNWSINAKVYTMPRFNNERAEPIITFELELFAQDPLIRSATLKSETGDYGLFGGTNLECNLPVQLNNTLNEFTATNDGTFASPALITISDDITNPRIINLTTGRFFSVEVDMETGDELIIDTENQTVTLNGTSVLADRVDGSNWLFVQPGDNVFVLVGEDFDINDQTKAGVEVEFYDVII